MEEQFLDLVLNVCGRVWIRFLQLLEVPINNTQILWAAIPLLIATFFMVIYFGRYKKEELGWNTAFGNAMVFMFMAINLIREMYYKNGVGSIDNILSSKIYLSVSIGLIGASICLMGLTYYRILPKRLAFFLFSAPTVNVTVYVIMAMVYANVPADSITVLATGLFLAIILAIAKIIVIVEGTGAIQKKVLEEEKEEEEKEDEPIEVKVLEKIETKEEKEQKFLEEKEIEKEIEKKK